VKWKTRKHVSPGDVYTWWRRWPHANVAVLTGTRSNLLVLDIDPAHGGCASLAVLEKRYGPLPPTVIQRTGSGGEHRLFTYPAGVVIGNSASTVLGAGLDTRGEGGLIIAPPSRHICGGVYEWIVFQGPEDIELPDAPAWLIALLQKSLQATPESRRVLVQGMAVHTVGAVIPEGQRNARLFTIACAMRDRGKTTHAILAELLAVNTHRCEPPLEGDEVAKIATSAQRYRPTFGAIPFSGARRRLDAQPLSEVRPLLDGMPARCHGTREEVA
jgi:hypothetical protein